MQRQFVNVMDLDDEHQPIAISIPEDSLISMQTSIDYLRPPKQEDCCEENAFCIYPIVQTVSRKQIFISNFHHFLFSS